MDVLSGIFAQGYTGKRNVILSFGLLKRTGSES